MVLSMPIFGLKQTSLPSPRSSVTNLTTAAAGHHRRNRTSSTVSATASGSPATTTTTTTTTTNQTTTTPTNREMLTEKVAVAATAAASASASANENNGENSLNSTTRTTAASTAHHDGNNDDRAPLRDGGNQSRADTTTTSSSAEKDNDTLESTTAAASSSGKLQKRDDTSEEEANERRELNQALSRLAELFPDIKIEVFRELLSRFDGTSRLQVCTEQLLRYRTEWVKGRWNVPGSSSSATDERAQTSAFHHHHPRLSLQYSHSTNVPFEEQFRAAKYRKAVRSLVALEFKALSRSTLDAVLAENNFSYSRARPTLRQLSSRTWRATLENFFTIRRKKSRGRDFDCEDHPLISWRRVPSKYGGVTVQPTLKETDSAELNAELHDLFVGPMLTALREEQESNDLRVAEQINEKEAKDAGALYECDCCLSDVIFEQIATCSTHGHIICFNCIRRTAQEALFGQGWAKSVDVKRATLHCLAISTASTTGDGCDGHLHVASVKRAVTAEKGGQETYHKFETRLAADSLIKSQLQLIYCPFCSYAEVDPIYHPPPEGIPWTFRRANLSAIVLLFAILIDLFPVLAIPIVLAILIYPSRIFSTFATSFRNLCLRHRSQRFKCANPRCGKASCITCHKEWRDPHVCHEPLLMSLRATVEAARTAAVKRTCPQCGLSFVKSSGCNKLTCVCGYSMCYLCRKALGPPVPRRRPQQQQQQQQQQQGRGGNVPLDPLQAGPPEDIPEEDILQPEGYKHFCEHFRAIPGSRCTECDKCDLYRTEDEEDVARRAGEEAERLWRIREGLIKPNARLATAGDALASSPLASTSSASPSSAAGEEGSWTTSEVNLHDDAGDPTVDTPGWNNMENLRIRLDEALAAGKGPDLFRTYGPGDDNDWWNARFKYWCWDVWLDGRWKVEGRRLLDSLVDLTVRLE